jgi:hypothetical protein
MKIFVVACAAVVLSISTVAAAEPGVSKTALSSMGLAGMQNLSDADGLAVRGKGTFASVWGGSTASWGGQSSSNNYQAGSNWLGKPAGATGSSLSFAGRFNFTGFGGR